MVPFESNPGVRFRDSLSRRDFLRMGGLAAGAAGLTLADLGKLKAAGAKGAGDVHCILLFMVGGPSQLDTFDLKPGAPDNIRGPFRPIRTSVPGMHVCEHFPMMAAGAKRFAIVRSVHHDSAPIHETGQQLMQTGRLSRLDYEYPHYGAVVSRLLGPRQRGVPPFVVVPGPIGNTGVNISHGQGAGCLGCRHEPAFLTHEKGRASAAPSKDERPLFCSSLLSAAGAPLSWAAGAEREKLRDRYGRNSFGQSCLLARRLVENGVRLVTVNMFDTVFSKITWDCHADGGILGTTLADYRDTLCPMFDKAYTALLEDLEQRGLLASTLVVAMGEFGRTPRLNAGGGRDHWPGVWSILFAGGPVRGGQVVGASDRIGAEPRDRPVTPAEVAATIYQGLGIDLAAQIPGPDGRPVPISEAKPIEELF